MAFCCYLWALRESTEVEEGCVSYLDPFFPTLLSSTIPFAILWNYDCKEALNTLELHLMTPLAVIHIGWVRHPNHELKLQISPCADGKWRVR